MTMMMTMLSGATVAVQAADHRPPRPPQWEQRDNPRHDRPDYRENHRKSKAQKDAEELKAMTEYLEAEKNPIPEPEPELIQSVKEWDVPKTEKIKYFDPSLSYELTGYRPITKDKGLDFDPKAFTEAADHYRKFGRYTDYYPDTYKW